MINRVFVSFSVLGFSIGNLDTKKKYSFYDQMIFYEDNNVLQHIAKEIDVDVKEIVETVNGLYKYLDIKK
jgi:hypothetical protein